MQVSHSAGSQVILDESAEAYHAKKEFISSSPLPEMAKSPAHFFHSWKNEESPSGAMDRGTFMHSLLLELDISKYVPRPLGEAGDLVRSNSKQYATFLAENPGKKPVHPALYADAIAILASACNHGAFLRAFDRCDKEVSLYGSHLESGLPLKARPDMLAKDGSFLIDVKTTSDMSKFERQIFNLGYDVRLAHYDQVFRSVYGRPVPEVYIFAMEQSAPYGTRMFRLPKAVREQATAQWTLWINEIAVCLQDGRWPNFSEEICDVVRPKYLETDTAVLFERVG